MPLPRVPLVAPLLDDAGKITLPWARWLSGLQREMNALERRMSVTPLPAPKGVVALVDDRQVLLRWDGLPAGPTGVVALVDDRQVLLRWAGS